MGDGERARAASRHHRGRCREWWRVDPAGYRAAETAACTLRVSESLQAMRVYVRLFRRTGDFLLFKRNGIEYEKAAIRAWLRRRGWPQEKS